MVSKYIDWYYVINIAHLRDMLLLLLLLLLLVVVVVVVVVAVLVLSKTPILK